MDMEFQVLDTIEKRETITQRDIARDTGISLGNVNVLIKRLVKKGLLKIERINPRTIRYILTPQGLRKKAEATYKYIVASYKYINDIDSKLNILLSSRIFNKIKHVTLYGNCDDIGGILINKLNHAKILHELCDNIEMLQNKYSGELVISWQPDFTEQLINKEINHVNLLNMIQ